MPASQQAVRAATGPPFPTAKFQPMNSPTSTIPTPSAQTWPGPSTRRSAIFLAGGAAPPLAGLLTAGCQGHGPPVEEQPERSASRPRCRLADIGVHNLTLLGRQEVVLSEGPVGTHQVDAHPERERAGNRPGAP